MLSLYHRIAKKSICNRGDARLKVGMTKVGKYDKIIGAGEVSEWLKEHAWKACSLARGSQVRILFSPPFLCAKISYLGIFSFSLVHLTRFERRKYQSTRFCLHKKRLSNTPMLGSRGCFERRNTNLREIFYTPRLGSKIVLMHCGDYDRIYT